MKKIFSFITVMLMLTVVLCSCSDPENFTESDDLTSKYKRSTNTEKTFNYGDGVTEPPEAYTVFSNQITDFELRMFRNYHKSAAEGTYAFSPAASMLQLGLAANGASDNTRTEITKALGINLSLENINQCSSYFKSRIEAVSALSESNKVSDKNNGKDKANTEPEAYVRIDGSLLFNYTADIKTKFLQTVKDYYGIPVYRFMFDDENSLTKVNNMFKAYDSGNKFSSLDKSSCLIATASTDICDTWLNAYAQSDISQGKFMGSNGEKQVTYMTSAETYMHTENAQAVMKYTKNTPLKFMAVLPNENINLDDYISNFTHQEFSNLLESVDFTKTASAVIPEFSTEAKSEAENMNSVLEKSGLYSLFTDKAEFENLTFSNNFMLNAMYEITPKLSVSSEGISGNKAMSKASLVQKGTQGDNSQDIKTDVTVEFNRPFIFLVLDNESNIPVYTGTVK